MKKILKIGVIVVSMFIGFDFIQAKVTEEDFDALYNEIVDNGVIYLDTVVPQNRNDYEFMLTYAVGKYETNDMDLYIEYNENDLTSCYLRIYSKEDFSNSKTYKVEVVFNPSNENIQKKVFEYTSKFPILDDYEENFIRMDDLDVINYYYNIKNFDDLFFDVKIGQIINYSSEVKEILSNTNITAAFDSRRGVLNDYSIMAAGSIILLYNDFVYGQAYEVGVASNNIIYIPDDTENTREAFIAAAKKRIDSYLGNDSVKITYGGQLLDIDDSDWIFPLEEMVNVDNTIGEYYIFNINNKEYKFFIEKNSDKMRNGEFYTVDINSNAIINSNSPDVPLDSMINFENVSKNSNEYKQILNFLGLNDAIVANIKLYSNSKDAYITKLENGKFKVYFPITKNMEDRDLRAYYITDENKIEEYSVDIIDGYAIFETNHFSTYTIGEKINSSYIENPETYDGMLKNILLGSLSTFGLIFIVLKIKKSIKMN